MSIRGGGRAPSKGGARLERNARKPKKAGVRGGCGGTGSKAKYNRRLRIKNTPVGWVAGRLLVTFMKAGVLESWRQMTDGNVWRREREVKGGGGELRHEKDRAGCGWKGKQNQGKFIFRTGQKESTISVGREEETLSSEGQREDIVEGSLGGSEESGAEVEVAFKGSSSSEVRGS